MFAEAAYDLIRPNLMSQIFDKGIKTGNLGFIIKTGLQMALAAIIGITVGQKVIKPATVSYQATANISYYKGCSCRSYNLNTRLDDEQCG